MELSDAFTKWYDDEATEFVFHEEMDKILDLRGALAHFESLVFRTKRQAFEAGYAAALKGEARWKLK